MQKVSRFKMLDSKGSKTAEICPDYFSLGSHGHGICLFFFCSFFFGIMIIDIITLQDLESLIYECIPREAQHILKS